MFKNAKVTIDRLSVKHNIIYQFGKDEYNFGIINKGNNITNTYIFGQ